MPLASGHDVATWRPGLGLGAHFLKTWRSEHHGVKLDANAPGDAARPLRLQRLHMARAPPSTRTRHEPKNNIQDIEKTKLSGSIFYADMMKN
jgi:hypothetical protein